MGTEIATIMLAAATIVLAAVALGGAAVGAGRWIYSRGVEEGRKLERMEQLEKRGEKK